MNKRITIARGSFKNHYLTGGDPVAPGKPERKPISNLQSGAKTRNDHFGTRLSASKSSSKALQAPSPSVGLRKSTSVSALKPSLAKERNDRLKTSAADKRKSAAVSSGGRSSLQRVSSARAVAKQAEIAVNEPEPSAFMSKLTKGIDTIEELAPSFEQSQPIDIGQILRKPGQVVAKPGAARTTLAPKRLAVPQQPKPPVGRSRTSLAGSYVIPARAAKASRKSTAFGARPQSRQEVQPSIPEAPVPLSSENTPKASLEARVSEVTIGRSLLESLSMHQAEAQMTGTASFGREAETTQNATGPGCSIEGGEPRKSMADVQKMYQLRTEFYHDFYKNVKSYKHFNSEDHFQDFLVRKAEAEQKKKEAQERTSVLFYESIQNQVQMEFKKQKEESNESPLLPLKGQPGSAGPKRATASSSTNVSPVKRSSRASPEKKPALERPPVAAAGAKQIGVVGPAAESQRRSAKSPPLSAKKGSPGSHSKPVATVQSAQLNLHAEAAAQKPEKRAKPLLTLQKVEISLAPVEEEKTGEAPEPKWWTDLPQRTRALIDEMKVAFREAGIQDSQQLWGEELTHGPEYITKKQFRTILTRLGYLNDFRGKQAVGGQANQFSPARSSYSTIVEDFPDKCQMLDAYQFEELVAVLKEHRLGRAQRREKAVSCSPSKVRENEVLNILSAKCFVLAINSVCLDWQLVERRRPKPPPPQPEPVRPKVPEAPQPVQQPPQPRLSKMEQRLLGVTRIQNREKEVARKSQLQIQKEEERRKKEALKQQMEEEKRQQAELKRLMAEAAKAEASSENSSSSDEQRAANDYFQLRKPSEMDALREQFVHLIHNRNENRGTSDFLEVKPQIKLEERRRRSSQLVSSANATPFHFAESVGPEEQSTGRLSVHVGGAAHELGGPEAQARESLRGLRIEPAASQEEAKVANDEVAYTSPLSKNEHYLSLPLQRPVILQQAAHEQNRMQASISKLVGRAAKDQNQPLRKSALKGAEAADLPLQGYPKYRTAQPHHEEEKHDHRIGAGPSRMPDLVHNDVDLPL